MAVHADDVLARATVYPDLAAALADCSVAVGTTSRRGGYRSRAYPLRAAAAELDGYRRLEQNRDCLRPRRSRAD